MSRILTIISVIFMLIPIVKTGEAAKKTMPDSHFIKLFSKAVKISPYVIQKATDTSYRYSMDPLLTVSIIWVESRGKWWARSKSGALGLMQVMPKFHYNGHAKDVYNINLNLKLGVKYLRYCFLVKKGYWRISAYNRGHNSKRYNRKYVRNTIRIYRKLKNICASASPLARAKICRQGRHISI